MESMPKKAPLEAGQIERHKASSEEPKLSEQFAVLLKEAEALPKEAVLARLSELAHKVADLERTSRTDELTGLLNLRGFHEEVHRLQAIFQRERVDKGVEVLSALLMIDLDGFKEVNDRCGHGGGDRCLRLISEKVRGALRDSDVFARVGGDEFSIFLAEDDEPGAVIVAEKVRAVIEGDVTRTLREEYPAYNGVVSASIGIVPIDGDGTLGDGVDATIDVAMRHADYAAYAAKAAGKKGELTFAEARRLDADGQFERDFLAGKELPR